MATTAKIAKEVKKLAEIAKARAAKTPVKFPTRLRKPLQELRAPARISSKVLALPDLFPQVRARGRGSWSYESQLVI